VNMDEHSAHKHHESVGKLLQYLIGPEMGQKGVIDGGRLGSSPAAMAARCSAGWGVGRR
jgi:hypothetical protein